MTQEDVLQALSEYYQPLPEREPGWITPLEAGKYWNCNATTARRRLQEMVETGDWESTRVKSGNGGAMMVYRKVKP